MKKTIIVAVFVCLLVLAHEPILITGAQAQGSDCSSVLSQQKLPVELKTRKKATRAQWEQVEKVLVSVNQEIGTKDCSLRFDQLFVSKTDDVLFPITHVVMKLAPEASLEALDVYTVSGEVVGQFVSRVPHERTGGLYAQDSSTLYSFQYKNKKDGEMTSLGRRLLKDDYFVRWADLKSRVALSGGSGSK